MNELANVLKVADAALRTVRAIEIVKKSVMILAAAVCCLFAFRFFSK